MAQPITWSPRALFKNHPTRYANAQLYNLGAGRGSRQDATIVILVLSRFLGSLYCRAILERTAGAFVCAHDYHALRAVQATQPLQFVAASWLVVGTG